MSRRRARPDALTLLRGDHARLVKLFTRIARRSVDAETRRLTELACRELELHAQLEEELFYPAVRHQLADRGCLEEGAVEHRTIDVLVEGLRSRWSDEMRFKATARVLAEHLAHHLEKEEQRIFPLVRRASLDLAGLGEQLQRRRDEIEAQRQAAEPRVWHAGRTPRQTAAARYPGLAPF
jgi:hemerythrin superfamily protein